VIIFNKAEGVMQLHEKKGKHGAPVTCGDWLFDNRLGLASGVRVMPDLAPPAHQGIATKSPCAAGGQPAPSQVKISQPVAETSAKWESYSKFRLGGMLSKVRGPQPRPRGRTQPEAWSHPGPTSAPPQPLLQVPKHIRAAGAPSMLQFTPGYPPFVAVAVGAKCAQQVTRDSAGLRALAQRYSVGPTACSVWAAAPGHFLDTRSSRYLLTFDTTRVHEDLGLTFPGMRIVYAWCMHGAHKDFGTRLAHLARPLHGLRRFPRAPSPHQHHLPCWLQRTMDRSPGSVGCRTTC